jgi:serine/threonine-protein kinase RsbT
METTVAEQVVQLQSGEDVVRMRQVLREWAVNLGLNLVDQTKLVTAASELARNTLRYGGGGSVEMCIVKSTVRRGCRLKFIDDGPGIEDIETALRDGYTSGGGLGLGLGGAKRLCDEFEIESQLGHGTRVTITKWKIL